MQKFAVFLTFLAVALARPQKSIEIDSPKPMEVMEPLPLEVAAPSFAAVSEGVVYPDASFDVPQPALSLTQPEMHLPKGAPEIYDVPAAALELPGNSVLEKKLLLNIPSPVIEAPKPIIQSKPTLFKVPQLIIQMPNPVVQHKPILHKVPHTLLINTPELTLQKYHVAVPQMKIIKGTKSAYTQVEKSVSKPVVPVAAGKTVSVTKKITLPKALSAGLDVEGGFVGKALSAIKHAEDYKMKAFGLN